MKYLKELFSTNNILKYSIILVLAIVVVLSTTLAYYSWGSSANTNISFDVIADSVYIEYDGGADITGANLFPTDDKNDGIKKDITVRVEKESSSAKFNLYLDLKTLPNALKEESFRYAIYNGTTLIKEGGMTDTTVTCSTNSTNHIVLLSNITPTTTLNTYTLYIWIDGVNYTNPDTMMNQSFEFTLHADGENVKNKPTIYDVMALNAVLDNTSSEYVTSSTGIDFGAISSDTNGKGVYQLSSTASDTYPIYYYRGAVTDNNVLFADFCWKIVRTTETGGVKLIYNGVSSNGTCNNTGTDSQIGTKAFNSSNNSPAYVGYMYGTPYTYSNKSMSSITDTYYYGNSVTYSGGTYTLTDTITSSSWSSIYDGGLNSNHYTCFSTGTTCSSVYYIYYTDDSTAYYITLTGGKTVEDALSEMLDNNTTSSTIKGNNTTTGTLDYWYYTNIEQKGYESYVEDTVWCNDRNIYQKNGWDPNGGSTRSNLYFSAYQRRSVTKKPSLTCVRNIDKFTVSTDNGNGDLTYPIGLLTADEIMLAGGQSASNSTYYLYTGQSWWAGAPYGFDSIGAREFDVYSSGSLYYSYVSTARGVRPALSLVPGSIFSSGSGKVDDPYVVS